MKNQRSEGDEAIPQTRDDLLLIRGVDMAGGALCLVAVLQLFVADKAVAKSLTATLLLGGAIAFGFASAIAEIVAFRCVNFPWLPTDKIYQRSHRYAQWAAAGLAVPGAALMYLQFFGNHDRAFFLCLFRGGPIFYRLALFGFSILLSSQIFRKFHKELTERLAHSFPSVPRRLPIRPRRMKRLQ